MESKVTPPIGAVSISRHWPFAPLTEAQHRARSVQEAAIRREAARAEYEARNRCRVRQQGGAQ